MKIEEYTFTGYYPTGNRYASLYDEGKRTMFENDGNIKFWDAKPKIGDVIRYVKSGNYNERIEQVFINGNQVFQSTPEKEKEINNFWRQTNLSIGNEYMERLKKNK